MTGYDKALNAYQNAQDQNMSSTEIYAELLKGIITNAYKAKDAHLENDLEKVLKLNDKTSQIIIALRSSLDFENHKDASQWMSDFFIEITLKQSRCMRAESIEEYYEEFVNFVRPVYERWADTAKNEKLAGAQ